MEEFFDSCEQLYDNNTKLVGKEITMFNGTKFTAYAPKEIIDMVSEKLDDLAHETRIYSFQDCGNFHVRAYENILCLKTNKADKKSIKNTLYFIEDFETFNALCSHKKINKIFNIDVDDLCSRGHIIRSLDDWITFKIRDTNIETLKVDVGVFGINTEVNKYPTVNITYLITNTDHLSNELKLVKCEFIEVMVKSNATNKLSLIADLPNIVFTSPYDIDFIIEWWRLNKKYINIKNPIFDTNITLPAFENVTVKYNINKCVINLSDGTIVFNTNCHYTGNLPSSIREMTLYENTIDIPHHVEILKLDKLIYNKKLYQHVKTLQIGLKPDNTDIDLANYIKEYFPNVTYLRIGDTEDVKI